MAKEKRSYARLVFIFWLCVVLPVLLFMLFFFAAANSWAGFPDLPSVADLENPKSNLATEVYTADGEILGKYFYQNRVNVSFDKLNNNLVDALVSTEDERFYEHSGIDVRGLARAVLNGGRKGGASTITQQLAKMLFSETPGSTWERIKQKLQEWVIAAQLERLYTKDEIIAMYFNRFDFINNAVGIKSGAQVYFGIPPGRLNLEQSATLVGMLKNPSLFNPLRRPDTVVHRRNVVLAQMLRNGKIERTVFDSLKVLPLGITYSRVSHKDGIAPYFREVLRAELKKIFKEKDSEGLPKLRKANGEAYDIYKDGLKVYTTLNYTLQKYAEWGLKEHLSHELQEDFFRALRKKKNNPFSSDLKKREVDRILNAAVKRSERYLIMSGKQCANCGRRGRYLQEAAVEGEKMTICIAEDCGHQTTRYTKEEILQSFDKEVPMKVFSWKGEIDTVMSPMDSIRYYKSFLQAGLMSMDPHTGYIRAWVGGIDYDNFAYDHVRQGKRQVGSTFKPFVYAVAIDNGYSPCYEVSNVPYVIPKGTYGLLKDWAPDNSDKKYGFNVTLKYGLANSMNTISTWIMKQFGPGSIIKKARDLGITSDLPPAPSLALGVADVSVYEMVGAFSTFANKGVYTKPQFLARIENKDGDIIAEYIPETKEVMNEETAYVMLDLLKGVTSYNYNKELKKSTPGTGIRLTFAKSEKRPYAGISYPVAAKTGTTQNNSDGWFIGITPDLVTGVWVGAEDRSVRFDRTALGQGANTALPIWGYYMNKVYADSTIQISKGDFEKPEKSLTIELDCEKHNKKADFGGGSSEPNWGQ
ncbi:MAG: transglycosylase domain-containing protein [Flavobacteriales bacterium]|nr:transglycosylase domain-containing protein [Flavobacteriales bacterium]